MGHTCFSEPRCFPMPVRVTLSRLCCRYGWYRVIARGAMRNGEQKPQPSVCFSSSALRRPGFDVLLLRRLDGSNNGNSKKMSA